MNQAQMTIMDLTAQLKRAHEKNAQMQHLLHATDLYNKILCAVVTGVASRAGWKSPDEAGAEVLLLTKGITLAIQIDNEAPVNQVKAEETK